MVVLFVHDPVSEQYVFESARGFLEQASGVPVHVTLAEDNELVKAATALPLKPAIVIEYDSLFYDGKNFISYRDFPGLFF